MSRRPFSAQFMSGSGKKRGRGSKRSSYQQQKRRQELRRKAMQAGRPGFIERFPFLRGEKDPWTVERSKRQQELRELYVRDREKMLKKKKQAEHRLKQELRRQRKQVNEKYRLHELPEDDPRRKKLQKKADEMFEHIEEVAVREHEKEWSKHGGEMFKQLKSNYERDRKGITSDMKKESRRERGLPDEWQGPWGLAA